MNLDVAATPPPSRLCIWLCAAAALGLGGLLIYSACSPQPSAAVVALGKPKVVIAAMLLFAFTSAYLAAEIQGSLRLLVRRLALLAFSAALALLAAELGVRRFLSRLESTDGMAQLQKWANAETVATSTFTPLAAILRRSVSRLQVYELQRNLDMRFGDATLHLNAHGMRDSGDYNPATTGALRIVGIGDSGMFGWGVNQDEDYLSVLESNLNAKGGTRVDVLNFAVPGYNTIQEIEALRRQALPFRPRVVVVGWCDNDFGVPFLLAKPHDFASKRSSCLYKLLFYRRELLAPQMCKPGEIDPNLIDPAMLDYCDVPGVRKAFTELRELAARAEFHLLVFGPMRDEAVEIFRDLDIAFLNTRTDIDVSRAPKAYAVTFMHPKAGGHRVLAERLQRELERRGWLPGT